MKPVKSVVSDINKEYFEILKKYSLFDDEFGGGLSNKNKRTIKKRNKIIYKRKTINKKSNAKNINSKRTKKNKTIKHHRKKYKKYSRRTKH
jgi:hypothetical protein